MEKLTREQAAVVSAFTGVLCGPFEDLQTYAEKVLDRPLFTHEFGDEVLAQRLKIASKPDFINLCANR